LISNGYLKQWLVRTRISLPSHSFCSSSLSQARDHRLTPEEKQRNSWGTSTKFTYNEGAPTVYPSSLPGFFPPIHRCTCIEEVFDLPTLDGLHLVEGLCDGVFLGAAALAGFPSLETLPNHATLGHHHVNVHGSESRNKSMVIHIENPHEHKKTETIAEEMIDKRVFVGWPFLKEAFVVGVSDSLFRYENVTIVAGQKKKIVPVPHDPRALSHWKNKADRIEEVYSKKLGVITGPVEVLLHVRPLKGVLSKYFFSWKRVCLSCLSGLKRLESGAFVKDYEDSDKEVEHAVQMTLSEVASEDPRFLERAAPPLSEEFPEGCKVFFLGEHAYGVAAQVTATTDTALAVVLAVCFFYIDFRFILCFSVLSPLFS
jgi:5'-3' exoribonuclease 1